MVRTTGPAKEVAMSNRPGASRTIAILNVAVLVAAGLVAGLTHASSATAPPLLGPGHGPVRWPLIRQAGRVVFAETAVRSAPYLPATSLYSAARNGNQVERITHQAGGIEDAVASPDGKRIAYTDETYGRKPGEHYVDGDYVHVVNADGSDDRTIYRCASSACGELLWSPDGSRLLFADGRAHILEPDGHLDLLCIGGCPGDPPTAVSWSPDGQQLAFDYAREVSLDNGKSGYPGTSTVFGIGVMNADGSGQRLITNTACSREDLPQCFSDGNPIWSPDGEAIAFLRTPQPYLIPNGSDYVPFGGPSLIDTIRPDGSGLRPLTRCAECSIRSMAWSPSGRVLAYLALSQPYRPRRPAWTLNTVDVRSGKLHGEPLSFITNVNNYPAFVWAPNGREVAIGQLSGAGRAPKGIDVASIESDGGLGTARQLTANGLPPIVWLPRSSSG